MTDEQPQRDRWLELARRVTASKRNYQKLADESWRDLAVAKAVLYRGMADGLEMALDHHLAVVADARGGQVGEPAPLDSAMFSVWLHGNWRWLTSNMTTDQREAAADAVQRHDVWISAQDDDLDRISGADLRWWRE